MKIGNPYFRLSRLTILLLSIMMTLCALPVSADFVPVDYALDSAVGSIKASSMGAGTRPENVFKAGMSDYWDIDASQATAASVSQGKNQFWLAVDLKEQKDIFQFVINFQTNFTQLKSRVSQYRIEYTNDTDKWNALSNATGEGSAGLSNYNKPIGWTTAVIQNTADLVDGNGNKTMTYTLDNMVNARYVIFTGEMLQQKSFVRVFNFMVNGKKEVEPPPPVVYPTEDIADIVPGYAGMSLTIGRPALVELGGTLPKYNIKAKKDMTISGVLKDPDGSPIYTLPGQHIAKNASLEITPTAAASRKGTYVMEFTMNDGVQSYYDKYYFTAVTGASTFNDSNPYPAVYAGSDSKLVYIPDYKGNQVIDYSNVGYKGGGVSIPNVPVKIILEPIPGNADDYTRIQNAIDALSRITPDESGFRGAILLKAGTYTISKTLNISTNGIVIKGEGNGTVNRNDPPITPDSWRDYTQSENLEEGVTKLVATWKSATYDKSTALINVAGSKGSTGGSNIHVVDQYVPSGSHTIRLESVSGLSAGDTVNVKKAVNLAWVHDLYMDVITDAPGMLSPNQWSSDMSYWDSLVQERTISAVDAATNTISLQEPLSDSLDLKYGVSTVTKIDLKGRVENVGVENIQFISRFDKSITSVSTSFGMTYKQYEDELHAQVGVRFADAQNVWVRNYTTYHIDVAVTAGNGVKWLTIQDSNVLEPVSKTTAGERRYGFSISGGQLVLTQRAFARYPRHGYIVMGTVSGPNVFHDSTALYSMDASEPHLRWSSGGLYDNMNARIYIQDRWSNGTAHGWAGVNYTLWNNNGPYMISQPPLNANYLFGQSAASVRVPFIMDALDPGNVPNFPAYEYSNGTTVGPKSLFVQQLTDRLGSQAAVNISSTTVPDYIDATDTLNAYVPKLTGIYLDGQLLNGFDPEKTTYTVPIQLDYAKLPVLTAVGEEGTTVTITPPSDPAKSPFAIKVDKGTDIHGSYSVKYEIIPKNQIVTASNGSSSVLNLIDGNKNTGWSASTNGGVWVRFYLGDTPNMINSVTIGFNKDTINRRQYYFDIEVSNDGVQWTKLSNPAWQLDNLGNGHIMSHQVLPGPESSLDDVETFMFAAPVEARLVRITGYGSRNGTGNGTANANSYFSMDIGRAGGGNLDMESPTWPADSVMTASNITKTGALLTWTPAADNVGVTGYKIYKITGDTYVEVAELPSMATQYNLTNLSPDTSYTYAIKAGDAAGNWSEYGPSTSIRTDKENPNVNATITGDSSVVAGQNFSLNYGLNNVSGSAFSPVFAQDITVQFNPTALELVSAEPLKSGLVIVSTQSKTGQIRILLASTGEGNGISTNGDLLKLNWKAQNMSQSSNAGITLLQGQVANGSGEELVLAVVTHNVQIIVIDKTALSSLIAQAQADLNAAEEGTNVGQYPIGSKNTLQQAINSAQAVYARVSSTQNEIDNAVDALSRALQTFKNSVITGLYGDVTGDGKVTIGDLGVIAINYGKDTNSPDWNVIKHADINGDGRIDILDLAIIANLILN